MATDLASKECQPCRGDVPPLRGDELRELERELDREWRVVDEHHLEKEFEFEDFVTTLDFVNRVGELAEEQGHHPNICFTWGQAEIRIWTHKIDGLTESDFILAAKIEEL